MKYEIMSLEHLSCTVNGQKSLNDFSMRLFEDELTFIVGNPNAGKTVFTKVLKGEIDNYRGRIILDGKPYRPASGRRTHQTKIYTVSDYSSLMEDMTIAENIGLTHPPFFAALNYKKKLEAYVDALCRNRGIELDVSRSARNLTPMERLKIQCARALLCKARVLIFNNVLYQLSDSDIPLFMDLIRNLMITGIGILFLEPIPKHAVRFGDRIYVISSGCVSMSFLHHDADSRSIEQILAGTAPQRTIPRPQRFNRNEKKIWMEIPGGNTLRRYVLNRGKIYGVSSPEFEIYYWLLNNNILKNKAHYYYEDGKKAVVQNITYPDLLNGWFDFLSVAENIALPAAGYIAGKGFLNPDNYHLFLESEFSEFIEPEMLDWKRRLYSVREWECIKTVLYRSVLNHTDILLLSGILDQPNAGMKQLLDLTSSMAAERDKAVILLGKNKNELDDLCDELILIDRMP